MKITRLETFTTDFVGFVRVTTDTGHQGWGQVSTYNAWAPMRSISRIRWP